MQEDTSQKAVAVAANQQNIFFHEISTEVYLHNSMLWNLYFE